MNVIVEGTYVQNYHVGEAVVLKYDFYDWEIDTQPPLDKLGTHCFSLKNEEGKEEISCIRRAKGIIVEILK